MSRPRFVRYAPKASTFLLVSASDNLANARTLAAAAPLSATDGGAEGNLTLAVAGATDAARGVVRLTGQLGGTADAPDVRGVRVLVGEGSQLLAMGAVEDGHVLARSGTSVVGRSVLAASGGTLSGSLNLGGNTITNLGSGSASGDAATVGQLANYQLLSGRNTSDGYCGLTGGHVAAAQAPVKSTYSTGGAEALVPSDIGAAASSRTISAGDGLSGGGDLSANRTLAIAAFSGMVSKDVDPAQTSWSANQTIVHVTYDVSSNGMLLPFAVRLPPTVNASLRTELQLEFSDTTTVTVSNSSTGSPMDLNFADLGELVGGNLGSTASNNGRRVQKVRFQTKNDTESAVADVDIGFFRLRAWAVPRGSGDAL